MWCAFINLHLLCEASTLFQNSFVGVDLSSQNARFQSLLSRSLITLKLEDQCNHEKLNCKLARGFGSHGLSKVSALCPSNMYPDTSSAFTFSRLAALQVYFCFEIVCNRRWRCLRPLPRCKFCNETFKYNSYHFENHTELLPIFCFLSRKAIISPPCSS